ncbi:MAG: protease modulator HflC [Oscillospiraceae bacterium]|nr:protease modulator HflC [Oscillospiraceae bacterium]
MNSKSVLKWAIPILLIIIVITVASSVFYTVQENEYALIIRFSKIESVVDTPGLHYKVPFIDEIKYYPKTKLFYDINPSDVLTSDSKAMSVDSFVVWRISDPFVFYQRLGSTAYAESRLDAVTYNALKNIIGTFEQNAIISSADEKSRDYLNVAVTEQSKANAQEFGIEVIDVKIKSFELPTDNEQSVFRRMISDRERVAEFERAEGEKEANIIKNEVDKTVNITISDAQREAETIIAEGESEYMKILAEAYNTPEKENFYRFMRGLEALRTSLKGEKNTVILDKDSLLAQILIGP